ncbi:MAG: hypothetical protein IPM64_17195 [Phycisphaerales bacterium]|nr:hypothetical protein [Phycisphaerales bacterium]
MAADLLRKSGFPQFTVGQTLAARDEFVLAMGTPASSQEANEAAASLVPLTIAYDDAELIHVPRRSFAVRELSADRVYWTVEADYGFDSRPLSAVRSTEQATSVASFAISNTSQQRYFSKAVVARYGAEVNAGNLIGVSRDGIRGVDVPVSRGEISRVAFLPSSQVTVEYVRTLQTLAGQATNLSSYMGFAQGELLFLGASGDRRPEGDWQVTFRFGVSVNETGITVAAPPGYDSLTGISKRGWEYLDVFYEDVEYETPIPLIAQAPLSATVHRVFDEVNFATALAIPSL